MFRGRIAVVLIVLAVAVAVMVVPASSMGATNAVVAKPSNFKVIINGS